jgi:hypothetical protein
MLDFSSDRVGLCFLPNYALAVMRLTRQPCGTGEAPPPGWRRGLPFLSHRGDSCTFAPAGASQTNLRLPKMPRSCPDPSTWCRSWGGTACGEPPHCAGGAPAPLLTRSSRGRPLGRLLKPGFVSTTGGVRLPNPQLSTLRASRGRSRKSRSRERMVYRSSGSEAPGARHRSNRHRGRRRRWHSYRPSRSQRER